MSRRVFVTVTRGMTDKTAVCVFPWEIELLSHIHAGEVKEVSIEQMCDMQGPVKVEKQKLKKLPELKQTYAPPLREQLQAMVYVDPDEDPCNDPGSEYGRLIEKYGMDKEYPVPVVERIYGPFTNERSAFAARIREHANERAEKPAHVAEQYGDESKDPAEMSREELREACRARGIAFKATDGKDALIALLDPVSEAA